ncbi:hypothetical protein M404DRAFT_83315, partial [Pisolithus tinctorius Marx 270]
DHTFTSCPFLFLTCADGPGLLTLSNCIGHQGKNRCYLFCPVERCHKPGASQYYLVPLKLHNYDIPDCNHPNINI